MRHGVRGRKLGRTHSHRKALLNNLVQNLVINKRIKTTDEKAKEASSLFDRLVTFGKKNDISSRREAYKYLKNRDLVKILFENIAPELADRNGGYTSIHKTGLRKGDGAQISILQIVGFEKFLKTESTSKSEEITD